jgi:hypothetical protein
MPAFYSDIFGHECLLDFPQKDFAVGFRKKKFNSILFFSFSNLFFFSENSEKYFSYLKSFQKYFLS